jgi:molybdate transport system substrate-binding protein
MPIFRRRIVLWLVTAFMPAAAWSPVHAQTAPTVAAASDLKFALEEVALRFERETGNKVRLVFGSSGNFLSQILQGAPFRMFMSADEDFVFKLADAGRTVDRGRLYALGRIGIIVPNGSTLRADSDLKDLAAALKDGRLQKFAIANPEHAPYGARAREALQHAGLWEAIQPRLVLGENISQTAQFATSGSTQGGIIALSLARSESVARLGSFALIPADWHQPLRQRMVLLKDAPAPLRTFYGYMGTQAAQEIMGRYGFEMPRDQ